MKKSEYLEMREHLEVQAKRSAKGIGSVGFMCLLSLVLINCSTGSVGAIVGWISFVVLYFLLGQMFFAKNKKFFAEAEARKRLEKCWKEMSLEEFLDLPECEYLFEEKK